MDSQKVRKAVTPAKTEVQKYLNFLDSRFRGNDGKGKFVPFAKPSRIDFSIEYGV
jgi:hypothetical protein